MPRVFASPHWDEEIIVGPLLEFGVGLMATRLKVTARVGRCGREGQGRGRRRGNGEGKIIGVCATHFTHGHSHMTIKPSCEGSSPSAFH